MTGDRMWGTPKAAHHALQEGIRPHPPKISSIAVDCSGQRSASRRDTRLPGTASRAPPAPRLATLEEGCSPRAPGSPSGAPTPPRGRVIGARNKSELCSSLGFGPASATACPHPRSHRPWSGEPLPTHTSQHQEPHTGTSPRPVDGRAMGPTRVRHYPNMRLHGTGDISEVTLWPAVRSARWQDAGPYRVGSAE